MEDQEEQTEGGRTLLVFGEKTFQITVPKNAKITFGPWAPPNAKQSNYSPQQLAGTLRIYEGTNVVAVFSPVTGYRDTSLDYKEQVVKLEGETVWKSDKQGYHRTERVNREEDWDTGPKMLS